MTIYLNLNDVRDHATAVIDARGREYVAQRPDGGAGCYNVLCFAEDGELLSPAMFETRDVAEGNIGEVAEFKPLCLIGSILVRAGVRPLDIVKSGNAGTPMSALLTWRNEDGSKHIFATEHAKMWMRKAQSAQDGGKTWGEAFAYADSAVLNRVAEENSIL